jgi:hypothetical protein
MFGFFKKNFAVKPVELPIPRQNFLASEMGDDDLIEFFNSVFTEKRPIVSTLFLVALEIFPARYAIFQRDMKKTNAYPASMDGMVSFILDMRDQYQGDDLVSEINRRKWFFLYVAALLTIAQERAMVKPELWDSIANVWVRLMGGAKALRSTLYNTCIWQPDETFFFNIIDKEDDGVRFVEAALVPNEIRYHPTLLEWQQRNLLA